MSSSRQLALFIFCFFSCFGLLAKADGPTCLQGSGKKTQIHNMLLKSAPEQSLLRAYQDQISNAGNRSPAQTTDKNCDPHQYQQSLLDLADDVQNISQQIAKAKIKRQCFVASMKRQHGTDEYFCPSSFSQGRVPLGVPSDNGQCLSDAIVDYTRWAFHEAISCMSDPKKPIDPTTLFALMNNESAFHFYVASRGGVGIGQLTSAAIDAVNNPERSGSTNYIDKIKNSSDPHCAPFKKALQEPLKNSYNSSYCPLLQPSGGFARSLVYSLSYYLMTRDTLMAKVNEAFEKKGEERAPFYNYAALAMYGPTALSEQAHVIQAYSESKGDFKNFISALRKKIPYVSQTLKSAEDVIQSEDTSIHNLSDCLE